MAISYSPGRERARSLLTGLPDRFNDFCGMDQITFVRLADWCMYNADSNLPWEVTIEESLFVFLDIVAQGNSFREVALGWDHNTKLTQSIFLTILNALVLLRDKEPIADECPMPNTTKNRWRALKNSRNKKSRSIYEGKVKIGNQDSNGLDISQEQLDSALLALNNFIYQNREMDY